ncbi:hypothetical protein [Streptomyces chartreusis]
MEIYAEAVALVRRIMDAAYASDDEMDGWLNRLDRAFACRFGYVSDLICGGWSGCFRLMKYSIGP